MDERHVWFRFVQQNGKPYRDLSYDRVKLSANQLLIIDFRDKVHAENSAFLEGIPRAGLKVYENQQEREAGNALSLGTDTVGNRGISEATALLVVVPPSREDVGETVAAKRQKVEAWDVPAEVYDPLDQGTASTFDLEQNEVGEWIDTQAIGRVTDFPDEYFIRNEAKDIFGILKNNSTMQIVLVGSPGVGKSLLLVLHSFWESFHEKKNIVLVRQIKGKSPELAGLFIFLLQGQDPQKLLKWIVDTSDEVLEVLKLIRKSIGDYELCLDGIRQSDLPLGRLRGFSVLATSAQFQVKNDDAPVLKRCLVPFWSFSDLETVGEHNQWDEHTIKQVYYYSGGNLRFFLLGTEGARVAMDDAFQGVDIRNASLLESQDGSTLSGQVDRIRMVTVSTNNLQNYSLCSKWRYAISSMYALKKLGQ